MGNTLNIKNYTGSAQQPSGKAYLLEIPVELFNHICMMGIMQCKWKYKDIAHVLLTCANFLKMLTDNYQIWKLISTKLLGIDINFIKYPSHNCNGYDLIKHLITMSKIRHHDPYNGP